MANTSKPYKCKVAFKTNKEEDNDSSAGYAHMIGNSITAESNIVVSFLPNSTRENFISGRHANGGKRIVTQTRH